MDGYHTGSFVTESRKCLPSHSIGAIPARAAAASPISRRSILGICDGAEERFGLKGVCVISRVSFCKVHYIGVDVVMDTYSIVNLFKTEYKYEYS